MAIDRKELIKFRRNIAVIIGIDRYSLAVGPLSTPVADAQRFRNILEEKQGFSPDHIFYRENLDKKGFDRLWNALAENKLPQGTDGQEFNISERDCLVFYFAGHGRAGDLSTEEAGYLLPQDTVLGTGKLADNQTLVPMEDLFHALNQINAHHTLIILDCCYSGAFRRVQMTRGNAGSPFSPISERRFDRFKRKKAWQVITSSGPAEKAADWLGERGDDSTDRKGKGNLRARHSPFAIALFEALEGLGNVDIKKETGNLGDGVITSAELFRFLYERVKKLTEVDTLLKPQHPTYFPLSQDEGGQFIFINPKYRKNHKNWAILKHENPYKGLQSYDISDQPYYFGRELDLEKVKNKMKIGEDASAPLVLMVGGTSGMGKSSFVKAGVLPMFQESGYQIFQIHPGQKPLQLQQYDNGKWEKQEMVFPLLDQDGGVLDGGSSSLILSQKQVLYIDQYEELFTGYTDEDRQQFELALKALLERLMREANPQFRLILSIRSDFEWLFERSDLGEFYARERNSYYHFCRLTALGLDDMRTILSQPASIFAFEFEDDLEDLILEDLDYLPSGLPLLSHTMRRLVAATDLEDRRLLKNVYQNQIGGVRGVMQQHIKEILDGLIKENPSYELFLKRLILRMVNLSDGEYSRRTVQIEELRYNDDPDGALVDKLLETLIEENLVMTGGEIENAEDTDSRENSRVGSARGLVHDSLINAGSICKAWIQEFGKENLLLQRQVWQATVEYLSKPEEVAENFLWHDNAKIVQLNDIMKEADNWLNTREKGFVKKSWAKREDELARVKRERDEARSSALAAKGLLVYDGNNTLAYNLAVQAYKKAKTDDALNTLPETSAQRSLFYKRYSGHTQAITAVGYLPDGQTFVTASNDATAIHWKSDGRRIFSGHRLKILDMGISPDGDWLVTGSHDERIGIWNLKDESKPPSFLSEHSDPVTSICFSPVALSLAEGEEPIQCFLSGSTDNRVLLWDLAAGNLRKEYLTEEGVVDQIWSVAFSHDGQEVLAGTGNGRILHWKLDGEVIPGFGDKPHNNIVSAIAMHDNMEFVMSGGAGARNGEENKILLWERDEKTKTFIEAEVIGQWEGATGDITFLRDRDQFAMTCHDGSTYIGSVTRLDPQRLGSRGQAIMAAAFSPDGRNLLLGDGNGDYIIYHVSGQIEEHIPNYGFAISPVLFVPQTFSPEGFDLEQEAVFVGTNDGEGILVNPKAKNQMVITKHDSTLRVATLSGDKRFLLTGGMDGKVRRVNFHDAPAWERNVGGTIEAVAISHNGLLMFAANGEPEVLIWMGSAMEPNTRPTTNGVTALALSSDDQYLLIGCASGKVLYWDMDKNTDLTLEGHDAGFDINTVAISPDGNRLLTGGGDGKAILWKKDGTLIREIPNDANQVRCVRFSEDGQFILVTGENGVALICDGDGHLLQELSADLQQIWSGDFTPDGRYVATKSIDGGVRIWRNYYALWHLDWMEHLTPEEEKFFGVI